MKEYTILVTGIGGYLGSNFAYKAMQEGHGVIGIDNMSNCNNEKISILSKKYPETFNFYKGDLRIRSNIIQVFKNTDKINLVAHFAALKDVNESQRYPERYYENNVEGTRNLLEVLTHNKVKKIIFSSSAAVYGNQALQPVTEKIAPTPISIYAKTKLEAEELIREKCNQKFLSAVCLRYFNPMGMHKQKQIKYDFPETLAGAILESLKNGKKIEVFGNDYETKDGSCERDFIHVDDLISGHMSSIRFIEKNDGFHIFNLGTGNSSSVLEVIEEFKKITNSNINIAIGKRRNGDISISYANISKAKKDLNWKPIYNLNDMCKDSLIGA